jgi:hypothetical protein
MILSVLYDLIIHREPNLVSLTLILKVILMVLMAILVFQQQSKKISKVIHEK